MPLVFVHGVNVRQGELYDRELAFRNRHFIEVFYRQLGRTVDANSIFNPYWGDLGANLSADAPFLPRGAYEMLWQRKSLNVNSDNTPSANDGTNADNKTPLLALARTASLDDVIDLLWELADEEVSENEKAANEYDTEMARLAQRALNFSHSPEGQSWLDTLKTDDELIERLSSFLATASTTTHTQNQIPKSRNPGGLTKLLRSAKDRLHNRLTESQRNLLMRSKSLRLRLREDMAGARLRLRQKAVSTTARMFNEPLRAVFHQQCALLIGDSFAYFSSRGDQAAPAPIASRVLESLQQAVDLKKEQGGELIVIGHSMGGVILCDLITCYGKDIPIDLVITVGSQFPLFADFQMFPGINGVGRPVPLPENVKRWINIFDPHDFLGYPAGHMFAGVEDFHLPTYALGGSAHTNYFNRRSFYFHLARRLDGTISPDPASF